MFGYVCTYPGSILTPDYYYFLHYLMKNVIKDVDNVTGVYVQ